MATSRRRRDNRFACQSAVTRSFSLQSQESDLERLHRLRREQLFGFVLAARASTEKESAHTLQTQSGRNRDRS